MTDAVEGLGDLQHALMAVGRGDRRAFRRLYDACAPQLFAICLRILGDRVIAEEVLQETFLKIWRSAAAYDPVRARPMTWLGTIARNSAIDRRRTRSLRPKTSSGALNFIPDEAEPADQRMLREESERLALSLVSELQEDDEAEIHRIYFDGFTFAELAEYENKPLGTVKSKVRRILLRLQQKFNDE